ncbi:FAD-dependent monooxygenase [Brevibacterium marinum]|uniref:2-polyprenyl-6-methoxyphenol hydroxylase-like FAD-dependent oxidoreductase n=1 Tax=Brevibacterium marinum TaxID=418643 RepID=A0A846RYV6_9MICO|nr:FAD-dependent monooxygenase [Brevibacterium marinum]NJC56340.1 2-polyprenyl-6-methoxyphenol hydroxylase-like FAD-dependent oxidoreductase [Brevibacterium marinum]
MTEVIIVGAGPTGLMLAAELALAGVDSAVIERRPNQELVGTRALGLQARTLEVFDQRGIVDRFLAEGQITQVLGFGNTRLGIIDFPSRHPYGLGLRQQHTERIMAEWVGELGVRIEYGVEVTGIDQDRDGVDARLSDGRELRADYIVGCDGGRSLIRKSAGIDFPGWEPTMSSLIAEVELTEEPEWGVHHHAFGTQAFSQLPNGRASLVVSEKEPQESAEPTLDDLRSALIDAWGTDFGVRDPGSISRFTDMARQAATYRSSRVLLAGDSAHVHSPVGGQGLNTGVQDAANLGWKLAQVIRGTSPERLLDTYHSERHAVGEQVIHHNLAQTALMRMDDRVKALNEVIDGWLHMDGPRKSLAGILSGLDLRYETRTGREVGGERDDEDTHPLVGRRVPDLDLHTSAGVRRTYTLLHEGNPVLLNLGDPGDIDFAAWTDRVNRIDARYYGVWELPVIGEVSAPTAVLIRPDGYVAWVGQSTTNGLSEALSFWFGS